MTYPDPHAPGARPGTPDDAWAPQQGAPQGAAQEQPQKRGAKKWLPIAGAVAAAGVVGAGSLTGWFGLGDPKVGDCVQMKGETDFDVVDCGAGEAEYKIVGIQDEELTWPDFEKPPSRRSARTSTPGRSRSGSVTWRPSPAPSTAASRSDDRLIRVECPSVRRRGARRLLGRAAPGKILWSRVDPREGRSTWK
jgi:hypothetical protein